MFRLASGAVSRSLLGSAGVGAVSAPTLLRGTLCPTPSAAASLLMAGSIDSSSALQHLQVRWATKKSGGSTSNTRTSKPKFLGFKKMHGSKVIPGNIILRQRGTPWHPSNGVGIGRDHTLFALIEGRVVVHYDLATQRRYVSINDGTLENFPSKAEMKRRLADSIDVTHYMTLTNKQRYDYVMDMVKVLTQSDEMKRKIATDARLATTGRRKFVLHDLTLV
ncbi:hypothetical protein BASA61_007263 [Batrachochytrium salamandrivorans]|nr:hypothetical protein BASA62_009712 [Batrachochytrium salamandrivorans]KAH6584771.1 hypothetical protein BASA61_007263 [Batrachochytrium salamandrivorans]